MRATYTPMLFDTLMCKCNKKLCEVITWYTYVQMYVMIGSKLMNYLDTTPVVYNYGRINLISS